MMLLVDINKTNNLCWHLNAEEIKCPLLLISVFHENTYTWHQSIRYQIGISDKPVSYLINYYFTESYQASFEIQMRAD